MTTFVEEKLKTCSRCNKKTVHQRTNTKTSGLMWIIHIILILFTAGLWLLLMIIYRLLTKPIAGWSCSECRK